MDLNRGKEKFSGYLTLSVLLTVIIFIFAVFVGLFKSEEADFSVSGLGILFQTNPVFWFLLVLIVLLPLTVFLVTRNFNKKLIEKQQIIDLEQSRINQVDEFARQLSQDNLEVDFKLTGENDSLGKSLLHLRDTLKLDYDNNLKIRKEEEQRNWITEGSAHFSEVLRNNMNDLEQLSFYVIKDLTKYVNAVQGGFYLLDDSDPYNRFFKLTAFFAYDRRKFADQKIKWGDGLIGTCAMEKKTIHLKHVPETYIVVTSGLGEATPDNLLVVPILYEDQIFGVMEFASLGRFEQNHISLIEKTAQSVASTISTVKTNLQTAKLLEESKAQTQALTSHEEEMRQNMEELQATQEEALRQSQRLMLLENTLKQNLILAEFDDECRLVSANSLFYKKFEYSSDLKIEGKHLNELVSEENRGWLQEIINKMISEDKSYKGYIKHITRTGKELWTMASLSITRHEDKSVDKIMFLGIDMSDERDQLLKQEAVMESVANLGIKLELDINGNILNANKYFVELFKMSQKEITSLVMLDIINPSEHEGFNKRWESIISGNNYSGILRGVTTDGQDVWINGSFSVTQNVAHEIDRIIFVGIDITHERKLESELASALETVKKQEKMIRDSEKEMVSKLRESRAELLSQYKEVERIKNLNEKILDDFTDAIVTTSQDNRVVFFNKAAEELWQMDRKDVLEQDVSILFPESLTEKDDLLESFTRPGDHKIVGKRKKSRIINKSGKEKSILIMLAKARVDNENAYMALIQHAEK